MERSASIQVAPDDRPVPYRQQGGRGVVADVPDAQSLEAEEVRRHLVCLRGGALFLSPDEADLLATWLSEGITVPVIVHALERAADARRRRPTRLPFTLRAAKRHLGKASKGALPDREAISKSGEHPLQPLVTSLRTHASAVETSASLQPLADALLALDPYDRDRLERGAQALIRDFLLQTWESLSPWEREARLTSAREELGDLIELMPPAAVDASAREIARAQLRESYPQLSAATLRQVLAS
jgi:hypothetical protein